MPKKRIENIERFYEKKGQSPKTAEKTAYKIANSKGWLKDKRKKGKRRKVSRKRK